MERIIPDHYSISKAAEKGSILNPTEKEITPFQPVYKGLKFK